MPQHTLVRQATNAEQIPQIEQRTGPGISSLTSACRVGVTLSVRLLT
jgi:hypothetical protein